MAQSFSYFCHIKGLLYNLLDHLCLNLFQVPCFLHVPTHEYYTNSKHYLSKDILIECCYLIISSCFIFHFGDYAYNKIFLMYLIKIIYKHLDLSSSDHICMSELILVIFSLTGSVWLASPFSFSPSESSERSFAASWRPFSRSRRRFVSLVASSHAIYKT